MKYRIRIVVDADAELRAIPPFYRRQIVELIGQLLTTAPAMESKSRIKKLIQPAASLFRLRVGDYRVFYDIEGDQVTVLHVCHKDDCETFYGG
jgi:mRNA-degrading endonuclease RelE of RelBE toxin-antitoxin system